MVNLPGGLSGDPPQGATVEGMDDRVTIAASNLRDDHHPVKRLPIDNPQGSPHNRPMLSTPLPVTAGATQTLILANGVRLTGFVQSVDETTVTILVERLTIFSEVRDRVVVARAAIVAVSHEIGPVP